MTRAQRLTAMRAAGYHDDRKAWTRLYVEGRIVIRIATDAFAEGARARANGAACGCFECTRRREATAEREAS